MSLTGFALAQAGQALIRAMSKTTHEGKGCACIAYLCTILRMFPTLLPSCELCSWLAFAALEHCQHPRCLVVHSLQQRRSALRAFHAAGPNSASGFATPHLKHGFFISHVKHTHGKNYIAVGDAFLENWPRHATACTRCIATGFQHLHNVLCTRDTPGPCRCASIGLV